MHGLLSDMGISVIAAIVGGLLMHRLKQPVILGYLIAGALIGPEIGLKWVSNPDSVEVVSEIGLVLLLFIIGLEIDPQSLKSAGKPVLIAGIGQFAVCAAAGLVLFSVLGVPCLGSDSTGLYLALTCALSSTAIVVKLLYDKREMDTLSGRVTLGVLILQDLWAILILAFQPDFANPRLTLFGVAVLKSLGLLAAGFVTSRFVLKPVFSWIYPVPEMVVAVSLGFCAAMSGLAGAVGLSMGMGSLIAGVAVSAFPYSLHVKAKTLPLRDFFLTLFFVSLGMKITMPSAALIGGSLGLVAFVVVSRFLSVYPLLALAGMGRRTCFVASINLAQISEFSLVIASLGVSYGHIPERVFSVLVYAMALTSALASYLIKYNHSMYRTLDRMLPRRTPASDGEDGSSGAGVRPHAVVLLGFHRTSAALVDLLARRSPDLLREILVIDFNMETLKTLRDRNVDGIFGDLGSLDTLEHAHLSGARLILCTIPDMLLKDVTNEELLLHCRHLAPEARVIVTADTVEQAESLRRQGAADVLLPHQLAAERLLAAFAGAAPVASAADRPTDGSESFQR